MIKSILFTLVFPPQHRLEPNAFKELEEYLNKYLGDKFELAGKEIVKIRFDYLNLSEPTINLAVDGCIDFEIELSFNEVIKELTYFVNSILKSKLGWVFDYSFQEMSENRIKKLLVSDMDKTMIDHETLDELAANIGVGEEVAKITEQAMQGKLDFLASLQKRVGLFKGQNLSELVDGFSEKISINQGAKTLVATMKKYGAYTVLVSGGFSPVADEVGKALGFDEIRCNQFGVDKLDGGKKNIINGELSGALIDSEAKRTILLNKSEELEIGVAQTVALGDGANDLPMLLECQKNGGLSVTYQGKPIVKQKIYCQINHTDLTSLLYFQGIHQSNWLL